MRIRFGLTKVSSAAAIALALAFAGPRLSSAAAPATAPAAAAAPATQPGSPNAMLADKGLAKTGPFYTLQAEQTLSGGFKSLAALKTKMDTDNRARAGVERQIQIAKNAFSQFELERRNELENLSKVKDGDVFKHNQIIAKIESLESKMKEAQKYKEDQEKELGKIGSESRDKYINTIIELAATADKAAEKYAALAKEKEVTDAVAANKAKLGPTPEFTGQLAQIKRLRTPIFAETIKVTFEGKVPLVEVTLNGSTTRKMVFDSGSSTVCIPASLAKAMELVPKKDDPEVQLTLADGKTVIGKLTHLKTVRVGQFTVNDVECAILPPELVAAEPLLGGSFLNNFVYKLDTGKEELHLARIGGDPKDPTKKPGAK